MINCTRYAAKVRRRGIENSVNSIEEAFESVRSSDWQVNNEPRDRLSHGQCSVEISCPGWGCPVLNQLMIRFDTRPGGKEIAATKVVAAKSCNKENRAIEIGATRRRPGYSQLFRSKNECARGTDPPQELESSRSSRTGIFRVCTCRDRRASQLAARQ